MAKRCHGKSKQAFTIYDTVSNFYRSSSVFKDPSHLNITGATQYTEELSNFIKDSKIFHIN